MIVFQNKLLFSFVVIKIDIWKKNNNLNSQRKYILLDEFSFSY